MAVYSGNIHPTVAIAQGASPTKAVAIDTSGALVAWGTSGSGWSLSTVPTGTGFVSVWASQSYGVAVRADGTVEPWSSFTNPPALDGLGAINDAVYAVVTEATPSPCTIVLHADGSISANNGQGGLLPAVSDVVRMVDVDSDVIFVRANGQVVGLGYEEGVMYPANGDLSAPALVAAGWSNYAHYVLDTGRLEPTKWSSNSYENKDDPAPANADADTKGADITWVHTGLAHYVVLFSDGTVGAYGWDNQGQATVPAGLTNIEAVTAAGYSSIAVDSNGTLYYWGDTSDGLDLVPTGPILLPSSYSSATFVDATASLGTSASLEAETAVSANVYASAAMSAGMSVGADGEAICFPFWTSFNLTEEVLDCPVAPAPDTTPTAVFNFAWGVGLSSISINEVPSLNFTANDSWQNGSIFLTKEIGDALFSGVTSLASADMGEFLYAAGDSQIQEFSPRYRIGNTSSYPDYDPNVYGQPSGGTVPLALLTSNTNVTAFTISENDWFAYESLFEYNDFWLGVALDDANVVTRAFESEWYSEFSLVGAMFDCIYIRRGGGNYWEKGQQSVSTYCYAIGDDGNNYPTVPLDQRPEWFSDTDTARYGLLPVKLTSMFIESFSSYEDLLSDAAANSSYADLVSVLPETWPEDRDMIVVLRPNQMTVDEGPAGDISDSKVLVTGFIGPGEAPS